MATFTIEGSVNKLFATNGDYHGEVEVTVSRSDKDNTYTISVTGIRAYCKYGWNFPSTWSVSLSGDGKSASNSGKIGSSGSNSYKGWLPKSGYNSVSAGITVNGNASTGACPSVTLSFSIGNSSVTWINAGITTAVSSTYSGDISSNVQSKTEGPNDRSAPVINVFTAYPKSTSKTTCTIKANVNSSYTIKKGITSVGSGN